MGLTNETRTGVIYRVMAYGTVMVRDNATGNSFPYYPGENERRIVGDHLTFITDRSDKFITRVWSIGN